MSETRQKGSTSNVIEVEIRSKVSSPVGMGLTGLAYNTAGLTMCYSRDGAAVVAIPLVTQTVTGAYSSGGFVEKDAVKWPGLYRVDVPNAAFVTGVNKVRVGWTGANSVDDGSEIDLTADDAYAAGLTLVQIAGSVWDELRSGHVIAGSFGAGVLLASTAVQAIWDALTSALTTVGSAGKLLVDNLNATVSSRMASYSQPAGFLAATFPTDPADESVIIAATDAVMARLGAPSAASVSADIAAVAAKTTNLPAAPAAVGNVPTATQIADALLLRNARGGSDGPANQSVAAAIAGGFMKVTIVAGVLTVKYADDTVAFTRTLTRAQLDAITAAV